MAKSDNFYGIRRGSTRSHTYQGWRDMQITKDRVWKVSNPQTEAQMKQRLRLHMVANLRRMIVSGLEYNGVNKNDIANITKNMVKYNLSPKNVSYNKFGWIPKYMPNCGLANYRLTQGALAPITQISFAYSTTMNDTFVDNFVKISLGEYDDKNLVNLKEGDSFPDEYISKMKKFFSTNDDITFIAYSIGTPFFTQDSITKERIEVKIATFDTSETKENSYKNWKFIEQNSIYEENTQYFQFKNSIAFIYINANILFFAIGTCIDNSRITLLSHMINGELPNLDIQKEFAFMDFEDKLIGLSFDEAVADYLHHRYTPDKYLNMGTDITI